MLGQSVRLRGPLRTFEGVCTAAACRRQGDCCNDCVGWLVVGDPASKTTSVMLRHHGCYGDESGICCRTEAVGQDVVVTGKLVRLTGGGSGGDIAGEPEEIDFPYAVEGASAEGAVICRPMR